jgi:excisionase family DNA binding protein
MPTVVKVLTVREIAAYLRVHPTTVYRLVKKGSLPAFRVGMDWRFNIESVDKWRMQQESPSSERKRRSR